MKKIILIMAVFGAVACGTQRKSVSGTAASTTTSSSASSVSGATVQDTDNNRLAFGLSLFSAALRQSNGTENVIVSPYSAGVALSMLAEGANGETKAEIVNALKNASYSGPVKGGESYIITSANSVWLRSGFEVLPAYRKLLEKSYYADIYEKDFGSQSTVRDINGWCSDKTNKRIPSIIDEISPDMVMFLINALYFKAPWEYQFEKGSTYKNVFHAVSGDRKVDFMHIKREFCCGEQDGVKYVILPYKSEEYQMIVCLPAKGADIPSFVSGITKEMFQKAVDGADYTEVALSLPKFKVNTTLTMNDILRSMGVNKAFGGAADFSLMTNASVAVDEVKQKCFIEVNEEGSEAAAVTSIGVRLTSVGPDVRPFIMNVDRPFVFAIFNTETKDILFAGQINTIAE